MKMKIQKDDWNVSDILAGNIGTLLEKMLERNSKKILSQLIKILMM